MAFQGLDPEAVFAISDGLLNQSKHLSSVVAQVDSQVNQLARLWHGSDNESFLNLWHGGLRLQLIAAQEAVHGLGISARNNAKEQERVSGQGGHSSGSTGHLSPAPMLKPGGLRENSDAYMTLSSIALAGARGESGYGDYKRLSSHELRALGIDPSSLEDKNTGFKANIFKDSQGRYVLTFDGTDVTDVADDLEDLGSAVPTHMGDQVEQATNLSMQLKSAVGVQNMTLVGHSLGGRLASTSSIATGVKAVTFNAAGPNPSDVMYAMVAGGKDVSFGDYIGGVLGLGDHGFGIGDMDKELKRIDESGQVTNIRSLADPLSAGQGGVGMHPIGKIITSNAIGKQIVVTDPNVNINPMSYHEVDSVQRGIMAATKSGGGGGGGGR